MSALRSSLLLIFAIAESGNLSWSQNRTPAPILQNAPELCGKSLGSVVPAPAGLTFSIDESLGDAVMDVPVSGSMKRVNLPAINSSIEQVCELPDRRLLVFGNAYQATTVSIVDATNGILLDHIDAVHPVMSPDQRWLAFETFYPEHPGLPISSEYRLYDLHKSAKENRAVGVSPSESVEVGVVVFPLVQGGYSEKRHEVQSSSFTWSADSRSYAFVDSIEGQRLLVLVKTSGNGSAETYVAKLAVPQVCESDGAPHEQFVWNGVKLEVSSGNTPSVQFAVQGVRSCVSRLASLEFQDLSPAEHERSQKRKGSIEIH